MFVATAAEDVYCILPSGSRLVVTLSQISRGISTHLAKHLIGAPSVEGCLYLAVNLLKSIESSFELFPRVLDILLKIFARGLCN